MLMNKESQNKIISAVKITKKELRQCYSKNGILAGLHHFTDYWARDGFFASFGALAIYDNNIVEKMLALFFSFQRKDGLIPYRIMNSPVTPLKYFGIKIRYKNPRPSYRLRGLFKEVYDGTTLAIIFSSKMGLKKYYKKIILGFEYLIKKEKHGLLWDGIMSEWNDTAYKFGSLLYSNLLYWYSYKCFNENLNTNKNNDLYEKHIKKQKLIEEAIRKRLWNGKYFADWHDYKRQDYFYSFGNLLAVSFGLATKKETYSILEHAKKSKIKFTLETNIPKYPFWRIDLGHHLIGMADYQNKGLLWLHPANAYVSALAKAGRKKQAINHLEAVSEQILKYKGAFECYTRKGEPFKRLFLRSEHPFAWSSGMFLWAANECGINVWEI